MKPNETTKERVARKLADKQRIVRAAAGLEPADLVLKNATYLNVFSNEYNQGDIAVAGGLIVGMGNYSGKEELDLSGKLVTPGFIDAHIHLESALVSPEEFAKAVVCHGTTTVITDPHEIANVMGIDGIKYMIEATENLPLDVHFMLPSCVPSTSLDEGGAELSFLDIDQLYNHPRVLGLAEMMNYVGVINGDEECISKILGSQAHHKKIDGHAPSLTGNQLNAYIAAGVYSDHECYTYEEALEKLQKGQFIIIREGTAAHNLKALLPLLNRQYYSRCMFGTDDKHPNDLLNKGHIDYIVKEAIKGGVEPIVAIKTASHHAARYFLLNNKGAIAPGYLADMVIMNNPNDLTIEKVFKKGKLVSEDGKVLPFDGPRLSAKLEQKARDTFHLELVTPPKLALGEAAVCGLVKDELVTMNCGRATEINLEKDILKIAVAERHKNTGHIGLGYLKGYGLRSGAVATSIAHDCHNIIGVGTSDEELALAINTVAINHGGIVVVNGDEIVANVPLEIAGLMSKEPLGVVNEKLEVAKAAAFKLGVPEGVDPFMSLSFLSLTVIPSLRINTCGVFDVDKWEYV